MTPSDFKIQFPEFAGEADARVQLFIDKADPHFDAERWRTMYSDGVANFVAHSLALANAQSAQGGSVAAMTNDNLNKKVGDVQVTKDTGLLNKQADNPFYRTLYGQQYLYLRKQVGMGALSV
jgi:Protein of unknown function (DUF4054)